MTTKNQTGSRDALGQAIHSLDDRLRQLQSITPGSKGGGSVAAPFSIGGYTFDEGGQVDLTKLADIARPGDRWEGDPFLPIISQGATASVAYTVYYSEVLIDLDEIKWNFMFIMTAAGTTGSAVTITLPRVALRNDRLTYVGQVQLYDASTTTRHALDAETNNAGTAIRLGGANTGANLWGAVPNNPIDVSDQLRGMLRYRPRSSG